MVFLLIALSSCQTVHRFLTEPAVAYSKRNSAHPKFLSNIVLVNQQSKGVLQYEGSCYDAQLKQPMVYALLNVPKNEPKTTFTLIPTPKTESKNIDFSYCQLLQCKYSSMLGVGLEMISNFPLYQFIDTWYGVRYKIGGNDMSGIDCSAFVQKLYEEVYAATIQRSSADQYKTCQPIENLEDLKEGDLVFFKRGRRRISHVGVYLGNNYFIHSSTSQGVTISNLNETYWRKLFFSAGKMLKFGSI